MLFQRLNLLHAYSCSKLNAIMMDAKTQTFWHLARSNGVCPAADLLRGLNGPLSDIDMQWTCWTMSSGSCLSAAFISLSSSSSEEDELRKRGSSFSIRLSAPKTEDKGGDSSNKLDLIPTVNCSDVNNYESINQSMYLSISMFLMTNNCGFALQKFWSRWSLY